MQQGQACHPHSLAHAPFHFGRLNHPFKLDVFHGKVSWKSLLHVPVPWGCSACASPEGCQALQGDGGPGNAEGGASAAGMGSGSIRSSETMSP